MWRVVVCDSRNLENEEAKVRYQAVKNTTTMGCNARKTNVHIVSEKMQNSFMC